MALSQMITTEDLNRLLPPERIAQGVSALAQLDADRQARRQSVGSFRLDDDDDEIDSPSPVYHHFLQEDSENITSLTNFSPLEFERLWNSVRAHLAGHWNVGRGRKSKQQPKDVLFMFFTVLKHCGKWDIVANVFHIKSGTFQKMVLAFAKIVSPYLYDKFVVSAVDKFSMETLVLGGNTFRHHPCARYATDVTFQQSNMPTGQMKERRAYYCAIHHLHGYKVEVSVLPNGLALNCTAHYPGSEADIEIFRNNHEFHLQHLLKNAAEKDLADDGPLKTQYPDTWAVLADKGYQGVAADFRAITPFKKTNDRIAHDRVLVENYFGRLCTLWAMCSDKYQWDEKSYDTYFRACVALTNFHVRILLMRSDDGINYQNYLKRLRVIVHDSHAKRLAVQRRYREKRRMRLRRMVSAPVERPANRRAYQRAAMTRAKISSTTRALYSVEIEDLVVALGIG